MRKVFWLFSVSFFISFLTSASAEMTSDEMMEKIQTLERRVGELESQLAGGATMVEEGVAAAITEGIQISGGISTNSVWNFDSPDNHLNGLRVFDAPANTANVEIVELAVQKDSEALGLGGRVDLNFLETAEIITPLGTDRDDFDVQQAYIYYNFPWIQGLTLKAGKFVTLLGAEVIEPWDNWNFSRSYLFGYAIPFTHVGLLGSYSFCDWAGATLGVVNGWDNIEDNNEGKTFLGNLTLGPWQWFTLGINGTVGPEQADENGNLRGIIDLVLTVKPEPVPQLTLMANYDYGLEGDVPSFAQLDTLIDGIVVDSDIVQVGSFDATWQGIAGYAKYDFSDRLYAAIRGEWFSDEDGARTGTAQDLWEITATGAYMVVEDLWARLEFRHDDSDATPFLDDGAPTDTQNTLSTEILYTF